MVRTLTIEVPGRPQSLNRERTEHWSKESVTRKDVRYNAKILALQAIPVPRPKFLFDKVGIDVYPWAKDRRFRQDVGNCYPSAKSAIDGLVDAHVIEDDDDTHLLWLRFYPHQFGKDQMVLVVHEIGGDARDDNTL